VEEAAKGSFVRNSVIRAKRGEGLFPAHINRPVPVLRIRKALCYRLHFRKGRSVKISKQL
jgi:hypothetical protein